MKLLSLTKREKLIKEHNERFSQITQIERDEAARKVESYFANTSPYNPTKYTEREKKNVW